MTRRPCYARGHVAGSGANRPPVNERVIDMYMHLNTCVLTNAEARALLAFASTDETRPMLAAVCVDWSGGRVMATDGHRLAYVNGSPKGIGQTVLARSVWAAACKASAGKSGLVVVTRVGLDAATVHAGAWPIGAPDCEALAKDPPADWGFALTKLPGGAAADVAYPPVDQVVPNYASAEREPVKPEPLGVNPAYLADLVAVTKAAGARGVLMHHGTPLDPIEFEVSGTEGAWRVVVMPMRV